MRQPVPVANQAAATRAMITLRIQTSPPERHPAIRKRDAILCRSRSISAMLPANGSSQFKRAHRREAYAVGDSCWKSPSLVTCRPAARRNRRTLVGCQILKSRGAFARFAADGSRGPAASGEKCSVKSGRKLAKLSACAEINFWASTRSAEALLACQIVC
jgi:hypothetical protein